MVSTFASTAHFTLKPAVRELVVAVFYHGQWKENRLRDSLEQAEETARDVHQRTGFVSQVRDVDGAVLKQFGYPVSEFDCDDCWEEEE